MQIGLSREQIHRYAADYDYRSEDALAARMADAATRGFMLRDDLIAVAQWKWRGSRTSDLCAENTEAEVEEITRVSFAAESERLRIGALLALRGVGWPMASVILHFAYPNCFPILDARAMNAVDGTTNYSYAIWREYCDLCRATATGHGVTLRALDRALWVFGKASQ